ncbi:hypothetical protein Mlute_02857 [Meiothermus luteus]|uniref:Uncharacterized protein n=1 Tax=Meiothermus luteus TaxID=2026184 RepID=A0A399EBP0_9DEIN|nr:hypothetical protein Mlute_02857 [Meiothermus luteus]
MGEGYRIKGYKKRPVVVLGRVKGAYQYRQELSPPCRHTRPVEWIKEIPRTRIDQDLLYSLGASMTVCRIQRNNAEERFRAYLEEGPPVPSVSPLETPDSGAELPKRWCPPLFPGEFFRGRTVAGRRSGGWRANP